jgi:Protein of unknown function (DUF3298)/Deacetylase PdaC
MMRRLIYLVSLSLVVYACNRKEAEKKAPIRYEMKNFRVESEGGCKSDTLPCAYYEVNYPSFSGLDTAILVLLKGRIDTTVSMGNPEAEGKSMQQIGDGFINDYNDFVKEMPESAGGWHYSANVSVETLSDTLLSLSVQEEYYTGGAHGGYGTYFVNINPATGAEVTLDNFLKAGYNEPLRNIGEKVFRNVREIPDTASLNESYFEFPEDKFELNQNYGFKKEGIVFFYNSYEIAPYAAGPTEILIPYQALDSWLKNK